MTFFEYTQAIEPTNMAISQDDSPRMDAPGGGGSADLDGEVMIAEPKTKFKRPPMYKVILLNDDYTPMDFVVTVIEQIFRKSHSEAMELMFTVHKKGAAVVAIYTRDVAETKVDQVVEYARINEYPLQ
jgi:ATP-dependent Clp protease adaptor protein ClpS